MSSAEAKNLKAISKAIDHHNASCPFPAVAIDMNPFEIERLGWDSIRGLPLRPNDGRAIPTFLQQSLRERPLTVFGDGSQTRSFCYVDDLIRGLVLLMEAEDVHEPVNLGNPNEMSLLELAQVIIELTESRSEIVFEALPVDDPKVRQPDISRAKDLLGWEPEVDLREGLRKTIDHAMQQLARPA